MLNYAETVSRSINLPVRVPSQNSITSTSDPLQRSLSFQFGNVTFTLDDDEFRLAFFNGRRYY